MNMKSAKNKNKSLINEEKFDRAEKIVYTSSARQNSYPNTFDLLEDKRNTSIDWYSGNHGHYISVKVGDGIVHLDSENSLMMKKYVSELRPFYEEKYKQYNFPKWMNKKHLELFLNLLKLLNNSSENLNNNNSSISPSNLRNIKYDFDTSRILIAISSIFNTPHATRFLVEDFLLPNLDKLNCLKVIKDFMKFSSLDLGSGEIITDLIQKSINLASKNIFYLINNMQEELFTISQESLEEIIERYFESVLFNSNIDHSLIMRLLMKSRNIHDIFELLEMERKKSIDTFEKLYKRGLEPAIQWKIKSSDPFSGYYKESEEFTLENVTVILINYYDAENDVYNIAIKLCERIENLRNKEEFYSDYGSEIETNSQYDSFIISLLSICEIKEINYKSKINFTCLFSNTKTKVLVCKIEKFSKLFHEKAINFEKDIEYTVSIYFNLSYNFSAILTHVCKNFYEYHTLNSISKIPKNVLNIILKNENLNLRSEDEILYSILNWVNNRPNVNPYSILELTKNVDWTFISLDCLLDFILSESKILMNSSDLQGILIQEFIRRFKEDCYDDGLSNSTVKERSHSVNNRNTLHFNNSQNLNVSLRRRNINRNYITKGENRRINFTSELVLKLINIAAKYEHNNQLSQMSTNLQNIQNHDDDLFSNTNSKGFSKNNSYLNITKINFPTTEQNAFYRRIEKPRNIPTIFDTKISPLKGRNRYEVFSNMNLVNTSQDVSMSMNRNFSNVNIKNNSNKNMNTSTNLNTNTNYNVTQSFSVPKNDILNHKQSEDNFRNKSPNKIQFSTFPSRIESPVRKNFITEFKQKSEKKNKDKIKLLQIPENYNKTKTNSSLIGVNNNILISSVINGISEKNEQNEMTIKTNSKNIADKSKKKNERIIIKKIQKQTANYLQSDQTQKNLKNRDVKSPLRNAGIPMNTKNRYENKINKVTNNREIIPALSKSKSKSKEKNKIKDAIYNSTKYSEYPKYSNINQYKSLICYKEYVKTNDNANSNCNCSVNDPIKKSNLNIQKHFKKMDNSKVNNLNSTSLTISKKLDDKNNFLSKGNPNTIKDECENCKKPKTRNTMNTIKTFIVRGINK